MPITPAGYTRPTLTEIKASIESELIATFGLAVDLSAEGPLGQFVGIFSTRLAQAYEDLEALYYEGDPDTASSAGLAALARLTGTLRRGESRSTVTVTITATADGLTAAAGALIVHVSGDPSRRFRSTAAVTLGASESGPVPFESEEFGPISALAGSLTEIAVPVAGWASAINPGAASRGSYIESDPELRIRRVVELARRGSHTIDAIRADLSAIEGVTDAVVIDNPTAGVANTLPPFSVECIILGTAATQTIVDVLGGVAKTAGVYLEGSTIGTYIDSSGGAHVVRYTIATERAVYARLPLVVDSEYAGDAAVQDAVATYIDSLGIGDDVVLYRVVAAALSVRGVVDIVGPALGTSALNLYVGNYPIDTREIAVAGVVDIL